MFGKLSPKQLKSCIFDIIKKRRKEVLVSAGPGEDCAVLNLEGLLLLSSDPITAAQTSEAGRLAVEVCCNDIAASGGEPVAMLITIIAPVTCSADDIKAVMLSAESAAQRLNVEICGGHTEFSDAVNRIIVSGFVVGSTLKPILTSTPNEGDAILMTKSAGLEGTQILYNEFGQILTPLLSDAHKKQLDSIEVSVVKEAGVLVSQDITSMHDITEGGVMGAVAEMCASCGKGAQLHMQKIPVLDATRVICRTLEVNPYKLISSGSMLFTAAVSDVPKILQALKKSGISATQIGNITQAGADVECVDGKTVTKCSVEPDEITRIPQIKARFKEF